MTFDFWWMWFWMKVVWIKVVSDESGFGWKWFRMKMVSDEKWQFDLNFDGIAPNLWPRVRYTFIQIAKKNLSKKTFIQQHFHPNRRQFHPRHFHPKTGSSMTFSSKNGFVQWHFHPKTVSSNDTFIPNHFHPTWTPEHLNTSTPKHLNP